MSISREEKEKLVVDLYFNQGKTFRYIAQYLRLSFTYISQIVKKHQDEIDGKNNNNNNNTKTTEKSRPPQISLSSKAYKLYYKGMSAVEVAIKLDIPESQATLFRLEYWRLKGLDMLESLHIRTKGKIFSLWKLYKELVINRGMSIEAVANAVDIALNRLPDMEALLEETTKAVARKEVKAEYLEKCIHALEEEKRRRNRIVTLPSSSYHYVDNPATNTFPYYYSASRQPPSLPYPPSGYPDLTNDYRDALKCSKEKQEIRGMYEGDIAD
jgi:hypothetical protein